VISRSSMKNGTLCLAAMSALTFAISFGCSQSDAAPPPRAAGPESTEVAKGPKVDAENYPAEMRTSGAYKAGTEGTVEITIVPKGTYHINNQYPYKFKAADPAPEGVTFPKKILKREDGTFDDKKGSFKLPFVVAKPGKAKIVGTLHLSVCSDANCVMEKQELEVEVDVK
jgi:hypothetical protein